MLEVYLRAQENGVLVSPSFLLFLLLASLGFGGGWLLGSALVGTWVGVGAAVAIIWRLGR